MYYGYGTPWFGGIGMGIGMIVFWGLLIWLIVWVVREARGRGADGQAGSSKALDILKERYAKGEISKEEFEAKKKDIF